MTPLEMCPDCTRPMDRLGDDMVCRRCDFRRPVEVPEDVKSLLDQQREDEARERAAPWIATAREKLKAGREQMLGRRYSQPRQETD